MRKKTNFSLKNLIPITVIVSVLYRETHLHLPCQNIVEKSDKENLKVIKNTLANESGTSWKPKKIIIVVRKVFNKCAYNWWGLAKGVLLVILCTVLWSIKKHCAAKILQGIWETVIRTNLVTNSLLFFSCPFVETKNKNQIFSKLVSCYSE